MKMIGESLNVISKKIGQAYKDRDPGPIQEEALEQKRLRADYIDINLGPARKKGDELMAFVVETVQKVITDIPLLLDTSNIEAIEAGLAVYKGPTVPTINSIMCRPERYEKMIPVAAKYGADVIALMWGPEGLPRDENERGALCAELVYAMNSAGIPNEKILVDGIVTPVNIQQPQLISLMNFQMMLADLAPGARSTCGLSNISNGPPDHLRPILNQTYMVMLERYGMWSVIADVKDEKIVSIGRGERPDIVELIHKTMDEEPIDVASLSKELQEYYKTVRVIMGFSLYSDSWLEV
ncbi:MAG: dihydropteroate synthase [Deltaproteobacteria bacterium]|nr:dihydropteroate synthase [Deltaproteobacteria bacterium]